MADVTRRGFIGTAAAAARLAGASTAAGGDLTFQNNVPDELLSGKALPTFKFELEKSEGKVIGGSSGKEATVEQLPISKGIAGVSMRPRTGSDARAPLACHGGRVGLRPGGPRPNHRHRPPTASCRDQ